MAARLREYAFGEDAVREYAFGEDAVREYAFREDAVRTPWPPPPASS